MSEETLTPNPCKCGRNVEVEGYRDEYGQAFYYIRCPKCGRETALFRGESILIQEWNKEDSDWVLKKGDNTLWKNQKNKEKLEKALEANACINNLKGYVQRCLDESVDTPLLHLLFENIKEFADKASAKFDELIKIIEGETK